MSIQIIYGHHTTPNSTPLYIACEDLQTLTQFSESISAHIGTSGET